MNGPKISKQITPLRFAIILAHFPKKAEKSRLFGLPWRFAAKDRSSRLSNGSYNGGTITWLARAAKTNYGMFLEIPLIINSLALALETLAFSLPLGTRPRLAAVAKRSAWPEDGSRHHRGAALHAALFAGQCLAGRFWAGGLVFAWQSRVTLAHWLERGRLGPRPGGHSLGGVVYRARAADRRTCSGRAGTARWHAMAGIPPRHIAGMLAGPGSGGCLDSNVNGGRNDGHQYFHGTDLRRGSL